MQKLKIADLKKIKEKVQDTISLREGSQRVRITVHMGTCGIASGARTILNVLLDEIEKRKITDVIITTSGCAGLCSREPMITVEIRDQAPIKYVDMTGDKIKRILEEHVMQGTPVTDYALSQGSETIF